MKINTNLLNLLTQILHAEALKQATDYETNRKNWDMHSAEVVRLKDAAVQDMIMTAPFTTTYTKETALLQLNRTLEMFKIYGKEDHV